MSNVEFRILDEKCLLSCTFCLPELFATMPKFHRIRVEEDWELFA